MKRSTLALVGTTLLAAGLCLILYQIRWLLLLLVDNGRADWIENSDISYYRNDTLYNYTIPAIIHQTWKDQHIPKRWSAAHNSCLARHPEYEHILWTDASSRLLIKERYPWFLDVYDAYPYPIQRVDAIRYFILYQYGGIYIDLDEGCQRTLNPLRNFPAFMRKTNPTGISNDVMGARPGHPFFRHIIQDLRSASRNWYMPYLTVMATTGPLFISIEWVRYMRMRPLEVDRIRVMLIDESKYRGDAFFYEYDGSSWHGSDVQAVMWFVNHRVFLLFCFAIILSALWFVHSARVRSLRGRKSRYGVLKTFESSANRDD